MFKYSNKFLSILTKRAKFGAKIAYKGLTPLAVEAIEGHYTDPSTGTLRELVALLLADAENDFGQHGYDGARDGVPIECKPVNFKGSKNNADGHGKINEHNDHRHKKALKDKLIMQQSQFFYGDCGWVVEFPYKWIEKKMADQITKCKGVGGRRTVAKFSYLDWIDCPDLVIRYINRTVVEENRLNVVGGRLYNRLYDAILAK